MLQKEKIRRRMSSELWATKWGRWGEKTCFGVSVNKDDSGRRKKLKSREIQEYEYYPFLLVCWPIEISGRHAFPNLFDSYRKFY